MSLYWHFFAILPVRQGLSCCIFPCRVIHRCQGHREWEPDSLVIVPLCWPPTSSKSRANLFGAAPSTQIHSFISFSKSVYHVWLGSKSIEMEAQLRHFGKPCQMQSDIDLRVSALLPDASPFSGISKNTCQVFLQFGNLNIFNLMKRWKSLVYFSRCTKKLAKAQLRIWQSLSLEKTRYLKKAAFFSDSLLSGRDFTLRLTCSFVHPAHQSLRCWMPWTNFHSFFCH